MDYDAKDGTMSFSLALNCLKRGDHVARRGWNGKGMFIFLVEGSTFKPARSPVSDIIGDEDAEAYFLPHINMRTANGHYVPWAASQTDILANDWVMVI